MAFLEWTTALSVGVDEIDEEHRKWFGYINRLYDSIEAGRDQEEVERILNDAIAFSKLHFDHEEAIFSQTDYPDIAYHKKLHSDYLKELMTYRERVRVTAYKEATYEVLLSLKKWLMNHVQEVDHQYIPYIHS